VRLYEKLALYDFRAFRLNGALLTVHAPGEIVPSEAGAERVKITVRGWRNEPYYVLLNGFTRAPQVKINGQPRRWRNRISSRRRKAA